MAGLRHGSDDENIEVDFGVPYAEVLLQVAQDVTFFSAADQQDVGQGREHGSADMGERVRHLEIMMIQILCQLGIMGYFWKRGSPAMACGYAIAFNGLLRTGELLQFLVSDCNFTGCNAGLPCNAPKVGSADDSKMNRLLSLTRAVGKTHKRKKSLGIP